MTLKKHMLPFQNTSPSVNYVRCHQFTKIKSEIVPVIKKRYNLYMENVDLIIKDALNMCIPNDRIDFRFYDLFGLDKETKKKIYVFIARKVCNQVQSMTTIKQRFSPYIIHRLYKPNGFSYNILHRDTMVGK